ncbi:hypothetical protein MKW98_021899 [Papaver atlanticum]|uniref:S-protein homolog n=1 Tax=Papaver atlanticum TaxID=357466 RepID=A0AAD4TM10_9MAGN|nr:hypothetical protein MKW98_021899 [Papaver atlanticum]
MMMSGRRSKLTGAFLLSVVVIFAALVSECSSREQPERYADITTVFLVNDISVKTLLNYHCYSSETDFGNKTLAYEHEFLWRFRINFTLSTKFWCDMRFYTEEGTLIQGGYHVYKARREYHICGNECYFDVRRDGLYRRRYEDYTFYFDLVYSFP